jgi:hypothetical protein
MRASPEVGADNVIALIIAIVVTAYLVAALVFPEKF